MAPRSNEEVGRQTRSRLEGWGVGGWSNDTLTFEPETNESIVIKLFICLFTMKNGEGRGGVRKTS